MSFETDIRREKAQIRTATFRSKLAKAISDDILIPILDNVKKEYPKLLNEVGEEIIAKLIDYIYSATPSGASYKIYSYDFNAPRGQKQTFIGEYNASGPGGPPMGIKDGMIPTGSLVSSLGFKILSNGNLMYGQLIDETGFEFASSFFIAGKIFITDDAEAIPVKEYGKKLEEDLDRSWFIKPMKKIRPEVMNNLRNNLREVLRKTTRKLSIRRAIVFKIYVTGGN